MGKIKGLVTEMGEHRASQYLKGIKQNNSKKYSSEIIKKLKTKDYILEKDTQFPRQPKPEENK